MVKATLCCFFMIVATVFAAKMAENKKSAMKPNKLNGPPGGPSGGPPPGCMGMKNAHECCNLPKAFSTANMDKCGMSPPQPPPSGGIQQPLNGGRGKRHAGGPGGPRGNFTCLLVAEQLLTITGEVDTDALKTKFIAAAATVTPADPDWPTVFDTSLTDCKEKAASNAAYASADQNQKNKMLMMCMRTTLLMKCPTASINAAVTTCSTTLASLSSCNAFMVPPPPPQGAMGGRFEELKKKAQGKSATRVAG